MPFCREAKSRHLPLKIKLKIAGIFCPEAKNSDDGSILKGLMYRTNHSIWDSYLISAFF